METTWTDPELRFLLGEMIKASTIDVSILAEFIRAQNMEQNWMNMQLPIGRTMQQCMGAAERVLSIHQHPPPSYYSMKRKSLEASEQPPKRQITMGPIESVHPPRNIQPRPIANNYHPAPLSMNSSSSVPVPGSMPVTGKKRGRPSKADKEAQARANSFRTMEYAPIIPAPAPTPAAAPMASINIAPPREYVPSPGYELSSGAADLQSKKRSKLGEYSPSGSYLLPSPASAPDHRVPLESAEQPRRTESPRDHGGGQLGDTRTSSYHQPMQHPSASPRQTHATTPVQQPNTLPPLKTGPSHEQYRPEAPRVVDPIFPDRDRSRSGFDPMTRATPPVPPVANRG
ncbi:hypothetical protein KJ359_010748 [Pestalotiopsis sp. 9143b]|nr:hypothetical protein KJ359_010748 [Pestalotiopsis sp. 9143b]